MKDSDVKFFKLISIIICLAVCVTSGVLIYDNTDHRTLQEKNQDYINSLK